LVLDEIHLLTDASRGPTSEILITKMRKIVENLQIIGLSATIRNAGRVSRMVRFKLLKVILGPVNFIKVSLTILK
jgi:helicase